MEKTVVFTQHAEKKLLLFHRHGFKFSKQEVEDIVKTSARIRLGYASRKVAERIISEEHLLRVIFEEFPRQLKIITMYPARRERYED